MFTRISRTPALAPWLRAFQRRFQRIVDRLSVLVRDRHTTGPVQFGQGQHDCALSSLYWAVPSLPESNIRDAFNQAADAWPYGGVTNKEFVISLECLRVENLYSTDIDTLGELLADRPEKCVALLHRHFIPIVDGVIVGHDARRHWSRDTRVYCHWRFNRRPFRPVRSLRRTSSCSA